MASKIRRPSDRKPKPQGKKTAGWQKVGVYLSPDAINRLTLHAIKRKKDWSELLDQFVRSQCPDYAIVVQGASSVSAPGSAEANLSDAAA